jgi:V/A-type H+-transporting ATPase subunit E
MGLEKVVEEVLASGEERKRQLLAETDEEAARIVDAAKAEVETYKRDKQQETWVRIERMKAHELQAAELELRRLELGMHRELLDRVEELALERLAGMPRTDAEPLLRALLQRHTMAGGKVLSSQRDEPLVRTLTSLRYGGHVNCIGGVVIENADGTVRDDRTFETILRERSEKALPVIAAALFGPSAPARKGEG